MFLEILLIHVDIWTCAFYIVYLTTTYKCTTVLQVCMDFVNFTFMTTAKYMDQSILQVLFKYMIFCMGLLTFAPGTPCLSVQKRPVCGSLCATLHTVRGDHGDIYHVPHLFPQVHHRLGTKSKRPITQNKVPIRIRGNNFIGYTQGQVHLALFPKLVKQFYFIFNSHNLIFSLIKWTKWDTLVSVLLWLQFVMGKLDKNSPLFFT